MSDQRIYDMAFTRNIARENGTIKTTPAKATRFEVYGAYQFKLRLDGKNFSTDMPARKSQREEYLMTMFRVRIDGKWHNPRGRKYEFFTEDEVAKMLVEGIA